MNKSRGLSLVELVVIIIAIIALLVAITIPSVIRAREMSRREVCATHLRALDQACVIYAISHKYKFPVGQDASGNATPQDTFRLMVEKDLLPLESLICLSVGGKPAQDKSELVGVGGKYAGNPAAAAEAFIHYGYQDIDAARKRKQRQRNGENYLPSPYMDGGLPVFADRGQRKDPKHGDYRLTGQGGANHPIKPVCQMWVGGAHGTQTTMSEKVSEDYPDDNIYVDEKGKSDSFLLSSEANAGP